MRISDTDNSNNSNNNNYSNNKKRPKVNHLLFIDDLKLYAKDQKELVILIQTARLFSKDIGTNFGIENCAIIQMKRGIFATSEGIELPGCATIRSLDDQEGYEYLGILQFDDIKYKEVKEKLKEEYARRVRKKLKSRLNVGNEIQAIHEINNTTQCRHVGLENITRNGQENKEVANNLQSTTSPRLM